MTCSGIKYVSLHEASGYGLAARGYLAGLLEAAVPLTWTPMTGGHRGSPFYYQPFGESRIGDPLLDPVCNKPIDYDKVILHLVPEYIPDWRRREAGKTLTGISVWETSRLPRHWPDLLNQLDALIVPCHWNKQVYAESGVRIPIHVVPHILEPTPPSSAASFAENSRGRFVFYSIGPWTARKAPWNTIRAYLDAFTSADPVLLLLKTSSRDFTRSRLGQRLFTTRHSLRKLMSRYANPAPIEIIDKTLTGEEMAEFHRQGNCFASLCHSEGWGLGSFEAATMGNPVLITGYGGQLDYLPSDRAYLVDYHLVPVQDSNGQGSYTEDQEWAEPSVEHASRLMRKVFEKPHEAQANASILAQEIQTRFSQQAVTRQLIERILAD
jgi:hypothetical protein